MANSLQSACRCRIYGRVGYLLMHKLWQIVWRWYGKFAL
nr:MAG TPA: hypothetical protein [Caudoviricetes sp.]